MHVSRNSHEKKKHLGSLLFILCLFCEYCHESVLKTHFLDVTFTATALTLMTFAKNVLDIMFLLS